MSSKNEDRSKNTKTAKKKKSSKKKDKLSNALQDQLSRSSISEFISQVRDGRKALDTNTSNEEEVIPVVEKSIKNKLSVERGVGVSQGVNTRKLIIFIAALALLSLLYFQFCGTLTVERNIYLSEKPIPISNLSAFHGMTSFQFGNPIYVHFSMGEALGVDKIIIKIFSVEQNSENPIGEVSATTKSHWKHIRTHFQKEFFEKRGQYKIQISRPNGSLLANQSFSIR